MGKCDSVPNPWAPAIPVLCRFGRIFVTGDIPTLLQTIKIKPQAITVVTMTQPDVDTGVSKTGINTAVTNRYALVAGYKVWARTEATSSDFASEAVSTAIEAKDIGVATDKSAATVAQGATSAEAGATTTLI